MSFSAVDIINEKCTTYINYIIINNQKKLKIPPNEASNNI